MLTTKRANGVPLPHWCPWHPLKLSARLRSRVHLWILWLGLRARFVAGMNASSAADVISWVVWPTHVPTVVARILQRCEKDVRISRSSEGAELLKYRQYCSTC